MALFQPDILQHNNPNLAISNSDFVKGGIRTGVATINDLYSLSGKTDLPSAEGQVKEHATIVYVSGETAYYVLVDVANIGNSAGWEVFNSGGGGEGTLTGATNGIVLANSGTTVALGGALTGDTTINASGASFNLTNIRDFQISSGITTSFGVNNEGLSFLFTGGSITYDTNQGIVYGGDYSSNFIDESLVSKRYVDLIATGLDPKSAVVLATTSGDGNIDLTGGTFVSGSTIDGEVVSNGWRVLIKDQTDASENGIYIYSASTSGFTRSSDFDGTPEGEVTQGAFIPVITGNTLYNTLWILTTPDPITLGVTDLTFTYFSRPTSLIAGTGITINTNTISVDGASLVGNSLKWTGNTFNVDITGGTLGTALSSKLDITVFSGYTGTTQEALTGITADIQYISGVTSGNTTSIENNYDLFTGYTATTQPIISAALTGVTSAGTGTTLFSGTTGRSIVLNTIVGSGATVVQKVGDEIQIYSSSGGVSNLTGATNGLCLSNTGTTVGLGGTLTGHTVISSTASKYSMILASNASFTNEVVGSVIIGGNGNRICTGATNGVVIGGSSNIVCTGGINGITLGGHFAFVDGVNSGVVAGNYSHAEGSTSVAIGGEYITTCAACSVVMGGCNNVLETGNTSSVLLGGEGITVSADTLIEHAIVPNLAIWNTPSAADTADVLLAWDSGDKKVKCISQGSVGITSATNGVCVDGTNFVLGGGLTGVTEITLSGTTSLTFTDSRTTTSGITYGGDYENNFQSRSLVTKQFVESQITGSSNTVAVYNASGATYTATTTNDFIGTSGGTTIYLPDIPKDGQRITVADIAGNALANSICICSSVPSQHIIGSASATINTEYGSITFIFNTECFWSAAAYIN